MYTTIQKCGVSMILLFSTDAINWSLTMLQNLNMLFFWTFYSSQNFNILQCFLKDHETLKTGVIAAENSALPSHKKIWFFTIFLFSMYFWSDKCRLGELKRLNDPKLLNGSVCQEYWMMCVCVKFWWQTEHINNLIKQSWHCLIVSW